MIELNGISVIFIILLEVSEHNAILIKGSISPIHMLPFGAGDEPAKDVVELFPNESSSVNQDIVQAQENSLCYVFEGLFQRSVFVENKYNQENW
jgi:hypothetical protein